LREVGGEPDPAAEEWADRAVQFADEVVSEGWQSWPDRGNACQRAGCLYEPLDVVQVVSDDWSVSVVNCGKHNETVDDIRMP